MSRRFNNIQEFGLEFKMFNTVTEKRIRTLSVAYKIDFSNSLLKFYNFNNGFI